MVEGEARAHATSVVTHVFSHLYLQDPGFDLGGLLESMDPELYAAAAESVKDQVEALLRKFLVVDPVTTADSKDGGDVVDGGPP